MDAEFTASWNRLGQLAFRRQEKIGGVFKELSELVYRKAQNPDHRWLLLVRNWLLAPFTLWPLDFAGVGRHICKQFRSGRPLKKDLIFMLEQVQTIPPSQAQTAIADYERLVEKGNYEPLIRAHSKYATQEKELLRNPKLKAEWLALKSMFKVDKFRDRNGILRRRMAQERNFRTNWEFKWIEQKDRFQAAFDAFCYRWNLYGMEWDKPLLLKLSVNPTAHGLMIVIPTYWSLDSKRDLNWRQINLLHKARGALRQGPKMSENRFERHDQAQRAWAADQEAKKRKLRGEARSSFVIGQIPLPSGTDFRLVRRLVKEGARLQT